MEGIFVQVIYEILPVYVVNALLQLPEKVKISLEEIRLRVEQPVEVVSSYEEGFLTREGRLTESMVSGLRISAEDLLTVVQRITNHSIYAVEEELRRGYLTLPGGHRIGMSGKVVLKNGRISHLNRITGLNIRFAREQIGVGEAFLPYIWSRNGLNNTMILSPPRAGKTTLLRDLARIFSYGEPRFQIPGMRVGIVDERSEIAGSYQGIPQKDVGPRTDLLDGCPKAEGMMMMVRSMSPMLLVVDEIGHNEDFYALLEAMNAGVSLLTTAHANSIEDMRRRPTLQQLFQNRIFQRYILLSRRKGVGTIEGVYDVDGKPLMVKGNSA